jgi:hypothetical protein
MPLLDLPVLSGQAQKSRGEIMASAVDNYLGEAWTIVKNISRKRKTHVGSS